MILAPQPRTDEDDKSPSGTQGGKQTGNHHCKTLERTESSVVASPVVLNRRSCEPASS